MEPLISGKSRLVKYGIIWPDLCVVCSLTRGRKVQATDEDHDASIPRFNRSGASWEVNRHAMSSGLKKNSGVNRILENQHEPSWLILCRGLWLYNPLFFTYYCMMGNPYELTRIRWWNRVVFCWHFQPPTWNVTLFQLKKIQFLVKGSLGIS